MDWIRKALGVSLAALGVYYCALGGFTLLRLPSDGFFMMLTALGAASIALLGWRTIVQGVATARGRRASWLGLAFSAIPLHWFWFLHRTVGAGLLDRQGQIAAQQSAAIQFGSVCLGYLLLWLLTRRPAPDQPARVAGLIRT